MDAFQQETHPWLRMARATVNGWNISGITSYQSGPDITTLSQQNLGLGGSGPQYDDFTQKNGVE
jgi:hypothetical protein